ncbi:MAG: MFS transporter [Alphaproteobacteria bacterium]|nr:MFS transporter [Alphaproteobacteria bacterium]
MKIRRNIILFKLDRFFGGLWPLSALAVVYFQQITGSYAFAMSVFGIGSIIQSLSEMPANVVSDRAGRRTALIISASLVLASFIAFALAGNIGSGALLIFGGVMWGMARAFANGTDDAIMYETAKELGQEGKYDVIFARTNTWWQVGLAVAALIAALVTYFYSLNVLAWVSAALAVIPVIIAFEFVEPNIHRKSLANSWRHFVTAWKEFKKNKKLHNLAFAQVFHRGVGTTIHRIEGAYFNTLIPTWLVNITRIIKQLAGALSFVIAPHIRKLGFLKILMASQLCVFLLRSVGLAINNFATPFVMSFVNIFFGFTTTAQSALLQKELSHEQRATMGSFVSLLGGLAAALVFYIAGVIADASSVYVAIIALTLCNLVSAGWYYKLLKRYQ